MSLRRDPSRRFLFRLALALGKSVAELEAHMSAAEFDEWRAFYRLEPFGEWRADHRAGLIAATMFNMNRGKDTEARSVLDFMPLIERPEPRPADPADIHARMLAAFPPKP